MGGIGAYVICRIAGVDLRSSDYVPNVDRAIPVFGAILGAGAGLVWWFITMTNIA
jgi:hypothetical protein